ncbi:MAG: DUF4173 domain-containing protein [Anaerolineae bacterium]|nr:DUF4173 domain-containing protein [Anaerolineae bacterium]
MDISKLKFPLVIIAVGFVIGLLSDLLLYGNPLGISVPIIIVLILIGLFVLAAVEGTKVLLGNLWLILPLLFMAAMSAVRAAPLLRFLNISGSLLLMLLLANSLSTRPLVKLNIGGYVEAVIESGIMSPLLSVVLIERGVNDIRQRGKLSKKVVRSVLIGLLIALPFLCIFTILFSSADLIFGGYVDRLFTNLHIGDFIGHTLLTIVFSLLAMGGLAYALARGPDSKRLFSRKPDPADDNEEKNVETLIEEENAKEIDKRIGLGMIESSVVLFSVDILFLLFVIIQFAALFGGEAFLRRQGLTYSEYARRGFFELLAVAIITLGLILLLDHFTRRETKSQRTIFLAGSGLMILMTIIILASAFERMQLYEVAYGFTRLRVYPHIFMVWLAILMAYFLVFLFLDKSYLFATGALVMSLGFVITLDILNPDAFIVRQNIARYEHGEPLDVDYLGSLSEDAIPAFLPLLDDYTGTIREQAGPWLHKHLIELDSRQAKASWPSYHFAINRAYNLLDARRGEIEGFEVPDWLFYRYD